jgi:Uma2 family endonuclease
MSQPLHIPQAEPPLPPRESLPTMYDLPSESSEEPGLPDEFHALQPHLLSETFSLTAYTRNEVFTGSDLNLYYDVRHPLWYKRPDWFAVTDVPRLYEGQDLRLSYVLWQEGKSPDVVIELVSPGTEDEDLGNTSDIAGQPPTKWTVYEQILRVPYYLVYNRYTNQLRAFNLTAGAYQEVPLTEPRFWLPRLQIGLGLWQGEYREITRPWLRWYDASGEWVLTKAERLGARLRELGIDPDQI